MRGVCGLVAVVIAGAAWGQQARDVQTGVKTTEPGWVASMETDVPISDTAAGEKVVADRLRLLVDAATREGFTPTGKGRAVVQLNLQAPAGDTLPFLVQIFIAEKPTEGDLKTQFDFQLLPVKAEKVAYTFHKGPLAEAQRTFMRLWQWTMAQNLDVAGYPYTVVEGLRDTAPEIMEVQLPVK